MARSWCSVVGDVQCLAPANVTDGVTRSRLATCYRCGEAVCREPGCSLVTKSVAAIGSGTVRTRRPIRICTTCLRQERGDIEANRLIGDAIAKAETN